MSSAGVPQYQLYQYQTNYLTNIRTTVRDTRSYDSSSQCNYHLPDHKTATRSSCWPSWRDRQLACYTVYMIKTIGEGSLFCSITVVRLRKGKPALGKFLDILKSESDEATCKKSNRIESAKKSNLVGKRAVASAQACQ
jgi:hypothetical protein